MIKKPTLLIGYSVLFFAMPILGFFTGSNSIDHTSISDYEKEKSAIMEVLEGESEAFWRKDFEAFSSYWVHDEYTRTMGWWQQGGISVVEGWTAQSALIKKLMESSPETNANANKVRRENINLRIFDDVAWLTFDQYGEDTGDSSMDMPGLSRETRIFEKHDGKWKIAYVGWLLQGE